MNKSVQRLFSHPFSFNGRIRRTEYGILIIIYVVFVFVKEFCKEMMETGQGGLWIMLSLALSVILAWFSFAQGAKRFKDVDCYCLEHQEIEENDNYNINKRIYLLTGRKLWLYISDNDCSNYDKMLDVLDNYFKIPMRDGIINLSKEDMKTVKHGGCIELEDISDEELAALKENRLRRPTVNRLSSAL